MLPWLAWGIPSSSKRWSFGRDLELTWERSPAGALRVGARIHSQPGLPAGWAIVVQAAASEGETLEMHPEVIAVSPDAKTLGVVVHTFQGEFSDRFLLRTAPLDRVAAHGYNAAGYHHHQRKQWADAADFFARATAADPTWDLPPYNLACAYARLGDERAEGALTLALRRAGAKAPDTKKKAAADEDFAAIAGQNWFKRLTAR